MYTLKNTVLAFIASATLGMAQNSTLLYNGTQINVQATNQYADTSLVGYHIGAALSYMVARTGAGNAFAFNTSATSAQLLNNNIASQYQLPCYVVNTTEISSNAGPLECGAGDQNGYYDVASVSTAGDGSPVQISFAGITSWYICAVQSFTYGWVNGTVVGAFGDAVPSGAGIQSCTAIDELVFASTDSIPSNTTIPSDSSMTASAFPADPTMTQSKDLTLSTVTVTAPCTTSAVVPAPSITAEPQLTSSTSASASISSGPMSPVATYTGAASTTNPSALIGLVLAVAALLL